MAIFRGSIRCWHLLWPAVDDAPAAAARWRAVPAREFRPRLQSERSVDDPFLEGSWTARTYANRSDEPWRSCRPRMAPGLCVNRQVTRGRTLCDHCGPGAEFLRTQSIRKVVHTDAWRADPASISHMAWPGLKGDWTMRLPGPRRRERVRAQSGKARAYAAVGGPFGFVGRRCAIHERSASSYLCLIVEHGLARQRRAKRS